MSATTPVFRHHHQMPAPAPSVATWRQLCQDWVNLNGDPHSIATLQEWAHREPLLAGFEDLGEIVDRIDRSDAAGKDALLGALVELAYEGDTLAGRVALQAMMPALSRLSRRCTMPSDIDGADERAQFTIASFWSVLTTTKPRPQNIARRLRMRTLDKLTEHRDRHADMWENHTTTTGIYPDDVDAGDPRQEPMEWDLDDESDLWRLLVWAIRSEALTPDDAQLLAAVYLTGDRRAPHRAVRPAWAAAARQTGVSVKTCHKRVERARDRLVDAVRADLSPAASLANAC